MKNNKSVYLLFFLLLMFSCSEKEKPVKTQEQRKAITILIQPFQDIKSENLEKVVKGIKKVYPNVEVLEAIAFPENTYYKERNRYRADSVIKFLSTKTKDGFVIIGLTSKDISTTKGKIKDFGIMGLGYRPGKVCVASMFRLSKENADEQFYKIAIHELGHTQGLPHCPEKMCFMRDAESKNPTNEETDFCKKCKTFLMNKNWKFSSI